jgi:hypothetical protein
MPETKAYINTNTRVVSGPVKTRSKRMITIIIPVESIVIL